MLTRGGGSFDDLLPFSDERVVRAVAACPVPIVSAVGHEQDTPLCDLAADARASTPTAAGRLVVPDLEELVAGLTRARGSLERCVRRAVEREREGLRRAHAHSSGARARRSTATAGSVSQLRDAARAAAPALLVERRRAVARARRRAARRALAARDALARLRDRPRATTACCAAPAGVDAGRRTSRSSSPRAASARCVEDVRP